jgi:methyltransferase (TIGR00027 family)
LLEQPFEELTEFGDGVMPGLGDVIALRTAWIDDAIRRWYGRQVVILGAGLDTRAARLAKPGVQFYEVDHPDMQADKLGRMLRLRGYPRDGGAILVPCDLEREDFSRALRTANFRTEQSTLVVWEGVTAYLTETTIRATLRRLASILDPRSRVFFDYLAPPDTPFMKKFAEAAASLCEPFLFTSQDIRPLLREEGFGTRELQSVADYQRTRMGMDAASFPYYNGWFFCVAGMAWIGQGEHTFRPTGEA